VYVLTWPGLVQQVCPEHFDVRAPDHQHVGRHLDSYDGHAAQGNGGSVSRRVLLAMLGDSLKRLVDDIAALSKALSPQLLSTASTAIGCMPCQNLHHSTAALLRQRQQSFNSQALAPLHATYQPGTIQG
jgi:hypothetical protein